MIWVKALHIASIALWTAGLVGLPGLYARRARTPDGPSLHRLQATVRFLYVAVVSPAAFVGVASGTALIFLRQTFEPWFSVKLGFVGALVTLHILTGLIVLRLFEAGNVYPAWRFAAVTLAALLLALAILAVVLAKPELPSLLPAAMSEPGALRRLADEFNPFRR